MDFENSLNKESQQNQELEDSNYDNRVNVAKANRKKFELDVQAIKNRIL